MTRIRLRRLQHEGSLERPLPFLAMGLIEGPTLENALKDAPHFPLPATPRIALGIARGLAAAHAKKVLHRDLKPASIILDAEGEAVLIDFGLARDEGPRLSTVTVEVLGTVPYFSPEHFQGRPTSAVSDVYQWGLLVHELLTGTLPYPALDPWPSLLERFEKGVRLPTYDPPLDALARLAERCLHPSPRRRPASATHLLDELTR